MSFYSKSHRLADGACSVANAYERTLCASGGPAAISTLEIIAGGFVVRGVLGNRVSFRNYIGLLILKVDL